MDKVIEKKGDLELVELGDHWEPWGAQINRYVEDGAAYGRPGRRIRVSMSNFRTMADARKVFGPEE